MKYNENVNTKRNSDIWHSASTSLNYLQYSDTHSIVSEEDGYVSTQDNSGNYFLPFIRSSVPHVNASPPATSGENRYLSGKTFPAKIR